MNVNVSASSVMDEPWPQHRIEEQLQEYILHVIQNSMGIRGEERATLCGLYLRSC